MRQVLAGAVCVLVLGVGACGAHPADALLTQERVRALVAEAAAVEPADLAARLAGRWVPLHDLDEAAPPSGLPLTLAVLAREVDDALHPDDLTYTGATPAGLSEAIHPHEVRGGERAPVHPWASLIQPAYVTAVTLAQREDDAWGEVAFGAPGLYAGRLHYRARRVDGTWRVVDLAFPRSDVRVALEEGRWALHLPARRQGVNPLRGPDLTLPRVTQVGTEPRRRGRILLSVTREGYVRVDGAPGPVSLGALASHLRGLLEARGPAWIEPDGSSLTSVLLDLDAGTPFCVVQWLMQVCARPDLKLYRLFFGVQALETDEVGALVALLPKDRSGPIPWDADPRARHRVKLFSPKEAGPSDLLALWAALLAEPEQERRRASFDIVLPPPNGPFAAETVLQVLDLLLRAGARDVTFEGAATPLGEALWNDAEAMAAHIRDLRTQTVRPRIKLDDAWLDGTPSGAPGIPRGGRAERFVGAGAEQLDAEVTLEEVPEEEVEETEEEVEEAAVEAPVGDEAPFEEDVLPFAGPALPPPPRGGAFPMRPQRGKPEPTTPRSTWEQAIDDGLRWLAAHQAPDGSWQAATFSAWCDGEPAPGGGLPADGAGRAAHDLGVSALAVCAFLGAGYTHRGAHPYARVVGRGLRHLKNVQDPEGCFGPRAGEAWVYAHAFASLAMVEAYAMTLSPIFKGSAQRALDFIETMRNPYFAWRYGVKPGDNDTSVTGCMLAVLQSARWVDADATTQGRPSPLTVSEAAFEGSRAWIDRLTDAQTGRVGYVRRGAGPGRTAGNRAWFPPEASEAMTAVGVLARLWTDDDPARDALAAAGMDLVAARPPRWDPTDGSIDMVYWYWGALAAHQWGGRAWDLWAPALERAIVDHQRRDGDVCSTLGSWDPIGAWGAEGGRVYATALMTLCLETPARYPRVLAR